MMPWEPSPTKAGMAHFKKPKDYDPSLAAQTLQTQQQYQRKTQELLATLGLADEDGIEVSDEDDPSSPLPDDSTNVSSGNRSQISVEHDTELQEHRARVISKQGLDQYRQDLLSRAATIRTEDVSPATRTLIAALMLEMQHMQQDNSPASTQKSLSQPSHDTALLKQYEEDIQELRGRLQQLEQTISQRDQTIAKLRRSIPPKRRISSAGTQTPASDDTPSSRPTSLHGSAECAAVSPAHSKQHQTVHEPTAPHATDDSAQQRSAALAARVAELEAQVAGYEAMLAGKQQANSTLSAQVRDMSQQGHNRNMAILATNAEQSAQMEALRAALEHKEARLTEALAEVADLRKSGARTQAEESSDTQQQLRAAQEAQTAAESRAREFESRVRSLESDMKTKEEEWRTQLTAATSGKDSQQVAALQKMVWDQKEQHEQRVAELKAELKLKEEQLKHQKADTAKLADSAAAKAKEAERAATASVRSTLTAMQTQLADLHAFREGILGDLLSMQKDMFNDKVMTQMLRMVRDKEVAAMKKVRTEMQSQVDAASQKAQNASDQLEVLQHQHDQQMRILQLESQGQIKLYKDRWAAEFEKRKKLHNTVLELRGSIRVLCRVRPLLDKESSKLDNGATPVRALNEDSMRVCSVDKADKEYEFDRVFAPQEDQATVFGEVEPLVTSVLDGYNVCIMAYGQTGSGKTHTMEGPETDPGVNQRALQELFRLAGERSEQWTYKFSATMLEIYNEQLFDLLAGGREQDADKLDIKQGPEGMYVPGARTEDVCGMDDVATVMRRGKTNRSTFATNMNEHSSRSHLVLSVYVTATSKGQGMTLRGKLHLVDLAGSERLARTGATGDRLKEAQNINKSLSALGDVIQALQQRNAHIPYRNSKLTRLLEDSLGSSSKCVLVVNVSPAAENVSETKCSLEFASRARKVELGRAKQNVVPDPSSSVPSPKDLPSPTTPVPPPAAASTPTAATPSGLHRTASNMSARSSTANTPESVPRGVPKSQSRRISSAR